MDKPTQWNEHTVLVIGLGRFGGGIGVVRFLAEQGARVKVTDDQDEAALAESIAQINDLIEGGYVSLYLGGGSKEMWRDIDWVVASPAIPPVHPLVQYARLHQIPVDTEISLLVELWPKGISCVAVTGSAGKSTTTALLESGLKASWQGRVWVGGNIGGSLLGSLPEMASGDIVVLELSSFMLTYLREKNFRPDVAVVTNLSPNHIDWHGTVTHYKQAKQGIFAHQTEEDVLLLGAGLDEFAAEAKSRCVVVESPVERDWTQFKLPGDHNRLNASMAWAVMQQLKCATQDAWAAIDSFAGLPHRMAWVDQACAVHCYNDSKSTTPEATILAVNTFDRKRVHVIVGGCDKGAERDTLIAALVPCASVACIGEVGASLAKEVVAQGGNACNCRTLERAVAWCFERAQAGDALILSPGFASWDQFRNYEERGESFIRLVNDFACRV